MAVAKTSFTNTIIMFTADTWGVAQEHNPELQMEHAPKLEEVRRLLKEVGESKFDVLLMIDAIQRLGIDYHFQDEIEEILQNQYRLFLSTDDFSDNLYEVALRFRLLRQEGYYVTADVFNNFKDKEGNFGEKIVKDIRGLIALYEASQLSVQGEDVLEEAKNLSNRQLNAWIAQSDHHQARIVRNTLGHPHHKSLARFMARNFLSDFQGTDGWVDAFRQLAKVDFNMVKSIHQKEILQVSKWWRDLGLAKELKFARNQPVKWYMWPLAVLPDPTLSVQRVELTKPISLVYIIDDIFDVHGTLDELTLFTEAVNRWEYEAVERLPDYMKICFCALNGITNEISSKVYKDYGWNPIGSLRKSWASLCNAFLVEAKWFALEHVPKTEDYLKNGKISSGVNVVLVHLFFLLGHGITKRNVKIVDDFPGIISSAATILRLWDDLGSAKDENQEGHDGSYLECYMKEHPGSAIEEARCHVMHIISETWKRLNQHCLAANPFSPCFTKACLNTARMVPLMYGYDENQCLPSLEELMKSLIF